MTLLSTTPIKGLRMHAPAEVQLDAGGAIGDREFLLVDGDDRVRSVTLEGALLTMTATYDIERGRLTLVCADGRGCEGPVRLGRALVANALDVSFIPAREVEGPWSALISDVVGRPLHLVKADRPGTASDLAPVTLLGDGSLRELERRAGLETVDPRRFRMLIQFGPGEAHIEDTWEGRTLTIGQARLRVGATVPRCAATTRHPQRGVRDAPIVRAIRDYRGVQPTGWGDGVPFGVYAEVIEGGRVRLGDPVRIDPTT